MGILSHDVMLKGLMEGKDERPCPDDVFIFYASIFISRSSKGIGLEINICRTMSSRTKGQTSLEAAGTKFHQTTRKD